MRRQLNQRGTLTDVWTDEELSKDNAPGASWAIIEAIRETIGAAERVGENDLGRNVGATWIHWSCEFKGAPNATLPQEIKKWGLNKAFLGDNGG